MNAVKKILVVCMAFFLGASAFSQVVFYNELSSDIIKVDTDRDEADFPGIQEEAVIKFNSARFAGKIKLNTELTRNRVGNPEPGEETKGKAVIWSIAEWTVDGYIEFSPFKWLTLGYNDDVWINGSYLPLTDDNISPTGKLGSDFAAIFIPVAGLRLGASIDFDHINKDKDYSEKTYGGFLPLNFGISYAHKDMFEIGATLRDAFSEKDRDDENAIGRAVGFFTSINFGSFTKATDLLLRLGFSSFEHWGYFETKHERIAGDFLFNSSAEFTVKDLAFVMELISNFDGDKEHSGYDFYFSTQGSTAIRKNLRFGVLGSFYIDFADEDYGRLDPMFEVKPFITFATKNHLLGIGVDMLIDTDADLKLTIPCFWRYSL